MACTADHQRAAGSRGLRVLSHLTGAPRALVVPPIRPAEHGGGPRRMYVRDVLNAVFHVLSTGAN
jgi:hypothetical protein